MMNHLQWMGHTETLLEIQRNLFEDSQLCDVTIYTGDNVSMLAHRFILCLCSEYFRTIFKDIPIDKDASLIIPDIKSNVLEKLLKLLYTGEVDLKSSQLTEFIDAMNFLQITISLGFQCQLNQKDVVKETEDDIIHEDEQDIENIQNTQDNEHMDDIQQIEEENIVTTNENNEKGFKYIEMYNENEEDDKMEHYSIDYIEQDTNCEYIIDNSMQQQNSFTITTSGDNKEEIVHNTTDGDVIVEDIRGEIVVVGNHHEYTKKENKDFTDDNEDYDDDDDDIDVNNMIKTTLLKSNNNHREIKFDSNLLISRNEALDGAIKSVIEEGMSLQKAASIYQISKTVLWRRVKKHPNYKMKSNPLIEIAVEKLSQGETLKSVSKALEIPLSTLHRYKVKLYEQGKLPENIKIRKKDSRDEFRIRLDDAVKACKEGMTQNHAANKFKIPKSTLWRHIKKSELFKDINNEISSNLESKTDIEFSDS